MILLDTNESTHWPKLQKQIGADRVEPLHVFDILIVGVNKVIGIECKREKDFSGSLHNKDHLFVQAMDMCYNREEHNVSPYFVFIGDVSKLFWGKGKMGKQSFKGVVNTLQFKLGIPIIFVEKESQLINMVKWINEKIDEKKEYLEPPPLSKKNRPEWVKQEDPLVSIDGIGRKNVRLLMDAGYWSNMGELFNDIINNRDGFELKVLGRKVKKREDIAGVEGIKGIGPTLLHNIYSVLDTKYNRIKK